MALEIVQIFVRPNIETPWFQDTLPETHFDYIRTTYSGKVQGVIERMADELMLTVTFTFTDEAAQLEFISDPYLLERVSQRDAYNTEHGIMQVV